MDTVPPLPPMSVSQHALDMSFVSPSVPTSPSRRRSSLLHRASSRVRESIARRRDPALHPVGAVHPGSPSPGPHENRKSWLPPAGARRSWLRRDPAASAPSQPASPPAPKLDDQPDAPKVSILDTLVESASSLSLRPPVPPLMWEISRSSSSLPASDFEHIPPPLKALSSGMQAASSSSSSSSFVRTPRTTQSGGDQAGCLASAPAPPLPPLHPSPPLIRGHASTPSCPLYGSSLGLILGPQNQDCPQAAVPPLLSTLDCESSPPTNGNDEAFCLHEQSNVPVQQLKRPERKKPNLATLQIPELLPLESDLPEADRNSPSPIKRQAIEQLYVLPLLLAKRSLTAQDSPRSPAEERDLPPTPWKPGDNHRFSEHAPASPQPRARSTSQTDGLGNVSTCSSKSTSLDMWSALSRPWSCASTASVHDDYNQRPKIQRPNRGWSASSFSAFDGNPTCPPPTGESDPPFAVLRALPSKKGDAQTGKGKLLQPEDADPTTSATHANEEVDADVDLENVALAMVRAGASGLLPSKNMWPQAALDPEEQVVMAQARQTALSKLLGQPASPTSCTQGSSAWMSPVDSPRSTAAPALPHQCENEADKKPGGDTGRARSETLPALSPPLPNLFKPLAPWEEPIQPRKAPPQRPKLKQLDVTPSLSALPLPGPYSRARVPDLVCGLPGVRHAPPPMLGSPVHSLSPLAPSERQSPSQSPISLERGLADSPLLYSSSPASSRGQLPHFPHPPFKNGQPLPSSCPSHSPSCVNLPATSHTTIGGPPLHPTLRRKTPWSPEQPRPRALNSSTQVSTTSSPVTGGSLASEQEARIFNWLTDMGQEGPAAS